MPRWKGSSNDCKPFCSLRFEKRVVKHSSGQRHYLTFSNFRLPSICRSSERKGKPPLENPVDEFTYMIHLAPDLFFQIQLFAGQPVFQLRDLLIGESVLDRDRNLTRSLGQKADVVG